MSIFKVGSEELEWDKCENKIGNKEFIKRELIIYGEFTE